MTPYAVGLAEQIARQFEGCDLTAYQNEHDVPTIGYGHTEGVSLGDTCTMEQAEAWLQYDLGTAAAAVDDGVTVPLTDHQAGALCDFVYNLGQGNFDASSLLRQLDMSDYADVPAQLSRWVYAGGVKLTGLINRRKAEISCWNTPD